MIGLVTHKLLLEHGEDHHPESRRRLAAILGRLLDSGWLDRLTPLQFAPATLEELAWVHDEDYIESLQAACARGGEFFPPDTVATAATFEAASLAAGGCIAAARAAVSGDCCQSLCLVRPPGHHALPYRPLGFCFFNNVALAAEAALAEGLERVAIVDFDAHHGNGTQDAFYHRRDVLYISLHETPLFPGTGTLDEVGVEEGAGYNVNLPLLAAAGDAQYRRAFEQVVIPALADYRPQLVLVSAGYDAHHADSIAHLGLTSAAFHWMTLMLRAAADLCAGGRIVAVLEGGYHLDWLPIGVENSLRALAGEAPVDVPDQAPPLHGAMQQRLNEALETAIETHKTRLAL